MSQENIRCSISSDDTTEYTLQERRHIQEADGQLFFSPLSLKPRRSKLGTWYSVDRFWNPERGTHVGQSGLEMPGSYLYYVMVNNDIERDGRSLKGPFNSALEARKAYRKLMEPYIK